VVVLVMENREYGEVIGNPDAPYVNGLAKTYGLVTRLFAISHPSLPNYLAMIGGSTFGIRSDCTSCHVAGRNLVDQLQAHHISWKAYMEDMPSPCFQGATHNAYAKRHDPFVYFDDIRNNQSSCQNVVPFKELAQDLSNDTLPQFAFVTPNVCHDMHDCSTATGDAFLKKRVPPILHHLGSNGVLFLLWDEGSSTSGCCAKAAGGHIAGIVAGPGASLGARSGLRFDTYSMLRTIEEGWGLPLLRDAGCSCTRDLAQFLTG